MSEGGGSIELKTTAQTPPDAPNIEPFDAAIVPFEDYTASAAAGNENGGTYFELEWQVEQAQNRQQNLLISYGGEPSIESLSDGDSGVASDPNFSEPIFYDVNFDEANFRRANSSAPTARGATTDEQNSFYAAADSSRISSNDSINFAAENEDFSDFHDRSKAFWRQAREMSAPPIVETETNFEPNEFFEPQNKNEKHFIPRYEPLLNETKTGKPLTDEFAETLAPNEREVFRARFQTDETFGGNVLESDGATFGETAQIAFSQTAADANQFADLLANVGFETDENAKSAFEPDAGESATINACENPIAAKILPNGETLIETPAEIAFAASETVQAAPQTFEAFVAERQTLKDGEFDNASKVFFGSAAAATNSPLTEGGNSRFGNAFVSDNSSYVGAVARRESGGGAAMGGALISGAYSSADNYKNLENQTVGDSFIINNASGERQNILAAGATGTMLSAALGSIIPASEASVGGVLGFVSGVVVGAETDQGLRWLSKNDVPLIASADINFLEENSFAPNLALQTV